MRPTEFATLAGLSSHKKWSQSLRVMLPDGRLGPSVETWLAEQGLDTPKRSVDTQSRPKRQKEPKPPPQARPMTAQRAPPPPPPQLQKATGSEILAHLSRQYIGLLPPDSSAAPLPAELPVREGVTKVMDLNAMSFDDIMAAARATAAADPFAARLPEPPGVRRSRQAFMTGHAPVVKRQRVAESLDAAETSFRLGEYLEGKRGEPPWEAMGLSRPPIMAGQELDLRALHAAVQSLGGYDAVTSGRLWSRVKDALDIDPEYQNAGGVLRGHYQRLLLRHERQVSAARSYSTRQAAAAAAAAAAARGLRSRSRSASPAVDATAGDGNLPDAMAGPPDVALGSAANTSPAATPMVVTDPLISAPSTAQGAAATTAPPDPVGGAAAGNGGVSAGEDQAAKGGRGALFVPPDVMRPSLRAEAMPNAASSSSVSRGQTAAAAEQLPRVKREGNANTAPAMQMDDGSCTGGAGAAAAAKATSQRQPVKQEQTATAAAAAAVDPADGVIDLCSDSGDNDGEGHPPPNQAAQPPPSDWGRPAGEGGGIPGL